MNNPILAQLIDPTSYTAIGWIVVGVAALCVAINQIDDFFERRKTKPGQPPNESLDLRVDGVETRVQTVDASLKSHVSQNQHEHDQLFRKIGGVERAAREELRLTIIEGNESRERLHQRINDLLEATARLEGRLDNQK